MLSKNITVFSWTFLLCFSAIAVPSESHGYEVILDLEVRSTSGGGGLISPVFAASTPADPNGLYVVEQLENRIRRVDLNTGARTIFFDATNIVSPSNERGWKSMAFHPDYATNGKVYFHEDDGTNINIVEYTRNFALPTIDEGTRKTVLSFNHVNVTTGHTAGWIGFSPIDDYLYIPTGDGGAGVNDPAGLPAQDLNDLRGKVLRIDVDGDDYPTDPVQNYSVPTDNPFIGQSARPEIFAYGVRNPWRAGFDSLTGDLYVGDVGSVSFEEINLISAASGGGQNFGWRTREGNADNPTFPDPAPPNAIDPLYSYPIQPGAAVVGGPVYRGSDIPGLQGHYIFADFVKNTVATFDPTGGMVNDFTDRTAEIGGQSQVAAIAEAANGDLYLVRRNASLLYKIVGFARGDFNRDGLVNQADLIQWQGDFGLNADSDADGDGDSDGRDFIIWQRQFGVTEPLTSAAAIPEPNSILLLMLSAGFMAGRRSRRIR